MHGDIDAPAGFCTHGIPQFDQKRMNVAGDGLVMKLPASEQGESCAHIITRPPLTSSTTPLI